MPPPPSPPPPLPSPPPPSRLPKTHASPIDDDCSSWALNTVVTYEDTAFYLEADTFDLCGGHSTVEGTYHYHSTAGCLQEQAAIEAGTSSDDHSAVLGWAYVSPSHLHSLWQLLVCLCGLVEACLRGGSVDMGVHVCVGGMGGCLCMCVWRWGGVSVYVCLFKWVCWWAVFPAFRFCQT